MQADNPNQITEDAPAKDATAKDAPAKDTLAKDVLNVEEADASSRFQDSLPTHPDSLLRYLDELSIKYTHMHHAPLRTVADSKQVRDNMLTAAQGGGHIKNLYLRDKKKQNFLAVFQEDRQVDLKSLGKQLSSPRLSFGSADRLLETLGVRPGAVTPLAMINGAKTHVTLALDASLLSCEVIYMHPLVNDQTIAMAPDDLLVFLKSLQIEPLLLADNDEA